MQVYNYRSSKPILWPYIPHIIRDKREVKRQRRGKQHLLWGLRGRMIHQVAIFTCRPRRSVQGARASTLVERAGPMTRLASLRRSLSCPAHARKRGTQNPIISVPACLPASLALKSIDAMAKTGADGEEQHGDRCWKAEPWRCSTFLWIPFVLWRWISKHIYSSELSIFIII